MTWGNGMGWGGWLLMTLTTVAFWAVVVFGIVALFRGSGGSGPRDGIRDRDARKILDERFARGEIDAEEYRSRQSILSTHG
ncbi:SHOCT domain-containing protein [Ornithinibacter aureus]|uniref:SHOCT domain-containing protein n=1 Tax=Ornithinibacter aureus TaxID=622664 RepID=A0ABP8K479_9MICO|nr:SHOCT domain-containing protein [Ornithinibacter aureus]KAF0834851.1 putative membrane protein [Ornithinibacter aureus]